MERKCKSVSTGAAEGMWQGKEYRIVKKLQAPGFLLRTRTHRGCRRADSWGSFSICFWGNIWWASVSPHPCCSWQALSSQLLHLLQYFSHLSWVLILQACADLMHLGGTGNCWAGILAGPVLVRAGLEPALHACPVQREFGVPPGRSAALCRALLQDWQVGKVATLCSEIRGCEVDGCN